MKELDFDELDRAVNSLMTNVPDTNVPQDDAIKTLTIDPTSTDSHTSAPAAPSVVAAAPSPRTATSSYESVAARRGGRFMDVVHPSSDMKKVDVPPRPPSRQGVTITRAGSPDTSPDLLPPLPPAVEKTEESTTAPVESVSSASEWPDPLDMAEKADAADDQLSAVSSVPENKNDPGPLTSPFLPDTKVEKRPLGGIASDESDTTVSTSGRGQDNMTSNDPDDQLPASPVEFEQSLPEELQGNLVAIESGASGKTPAPFDDAPQEDQPVSQPEHPPILLPEKASEPIESPSVSTGPVSIPQQYR